MEDKKQKFRGLESVFLEDQDSDSEDSSSSWQEFGNSSPRKQGDTMRNPQSNLKHTKASVKSSFKHSFV